MKKEYPDFKDIRDCFNALSKGNQVIINDYIAYCRKDAKESTLNKYLNKIVQIADVMEKPLNTITLDDVNKFLVLLNLSNRGTDTRNDIKKVLKRFLKWKFDDWNIRFKDFADIKQKRKGSSERLTSKDLLTYDELEQIIRAAESLRYKALIMLLYESACRPEECLKLRWSDIDFKTKEVSLDSAKTGQARSVPLDESILHLKRYYQDYPFQNVNEKDYIFPSKKRTSHTSNQLVNDYLKKLGLSTIKKHLYPYIFRHTRLQQLRKKLTPEAYEKIAGHSYQTGLETYGHLDVKEAKDEMRTKIYDIKEITPEEKNEIKSLKEKLLNVIGVLKIYFKHDISKRKRALEGFSEQELKEFVAATNKLFEIENEVIRVPKKEVEKNKK